MRRALLAFLRATHLIGFADRFAAQRAVKALAVENAAYRAAHPDRRFPDPKLLFEVAGHAKLASFDQEGAAHAARIAAILRASDLPHDARVLDWGAGIGRILTHLPPALAMPDARISGCDPNPRAVAYVRMALPHVAMSQSRRNPPAPYADRSFDAIYGVSILTHLSNVAARRWAAELARLVTNEGVVIVTTHGAYAAANLTQRDKARVDAGAYVVLEGAREGSRTYLSYFNETRGRKLLGRRFADVTFQAATSDDFPQDTWILRKPKRTP